MTAADVAAYVACWQPVPGAAAGGVLCPAAVLSCYRGLLAALRGDAATAETMLGDLGDLRTSENPQMQGFVRLVEGFTGAARRQHEDALRHARGALAHAGTVGISAEDQR